jgi:hypothetical protein
MPYTTSGLSQEQRAKADFGASIKEIRPYLAGLEEGPPALDALAESILRFGTCELHMRRAERLRALGISEAGRGAGRLCARPPRARTRRPSRCAPVRGRPGGAATR